MKGKISLSEFIHEVKRELKHASSEDTGEPFYTLTDVELETSFSVDASGTAGIKFVVDLEGTTKASQSHKVTLKLKVLSPDGGGPSFGHNKSFIDELKQLNQKLKASGQRELSPQQYMLIMQPKGGVNIKQSNDSENESNSRSHNVTTYE